MRGKLVFDAAMLTLRATIAALIEDSLHPFASGCPGRRQLEDGALDVEASLRLIEA